MDNRKPKIDILGTGEKASPYLIWAKEQLSSRTGLWFQYTGDCLIKFINTPSQYTLVFIELSATGFITHPRSSESLKSDIINDTQCFIIEDGWDYTTYFPISIESSFVYPLVDSDNTSMSFTGDSSINAVEPLGSGGNYGNIYWHNNDPENLSVISYKGTPTRHFSLPNLDIATGADNTFNGYGVAIYKAGELLTYSKDNKPIFGAAEIDGELICCTSEGVSVLRGDVWVDIPLTDYVVRGLWFFDSSGTKAITADGSRLLTVAKDGDSFSGTIHTYYTEPPTNTLDFNASSSEGSSTYIYSSAGESRKFFELDSTGDEKFLGVTFQLDSTTEYTSSSSVSYSNVIIYASTGPYSVAVAGPDSSGVICASLLANGVPANYGGECGPLTYKFSGRVTQIGDTNCAVLENGGCSSEDITLTVGVTITGPGISASGSIDVFVPASPGYWSAADSCTLSYVNRSASEVGGGGCYDGGTYIGWNPGTCSGTESDESASRCAVYISSLPPSAQGETVISGGIKTVYIKQGSTKVDVGSLPASCGCSYETGAPYANIEGETITTQDLMYLTRNDAPCSGSILTYFGSLCPTGDCSGYSSPIATCHTATKTTSSGTNVRAGYLTYHWVCL